jgi:hypothetical protein
LSGSYEPRNRVLSFSPFGLKAPEDRVVILPFPSTGTRPEPDPDTILILMTGIAQWMQPEDFAVFKEAFMRGYARWGASAFWSSATPTIPRAGSRN